MYRWGRAGDDEMIMMHDLERGGVSVNPGSSLAAPVYDPVQIWQDHEVRPVLRERNSMAPL